MSRRKPVPVKIEYINALPLTGKTTWCVNKLVEFHKEHSMDSGNQVKCIIYAGLPDQLLGIYNKLINEEKIPKEYVSYIHHEGSTNQIDHSEHERLLACLTWGLPRFLSESEDGYSHSVSLPGSIILMNMFALWDCHADKQFWETNPLLKKEDVTVIIDNAREFPIDETEFKIKGKENIKRFLNILNIDNVQDYKLPGIKYYLTTDIIEKVIQLEVNAKEDFNGSFLPLTYQTEFDAFPIHLALKIISHKDSQELVLIGRRVCMLYELLHRWNKLYLVSDTFKTSKFYCFAYEHRHGFGRKYPPIQFVNITHESLSAERLKEVETRLINTTITYLAREDIRMGNSEFDYGTDDPNAEFVLVNEIPST